MEIPYHIINIFKTILNTTPSETLDSQNSGGVLEIFGTVLRNLGYAGNIICLILSIVEVLWNFYKFIKGWFTGQSALEYKQD